MPSTLTIAHAALRANLRRAAELAPGCAVLLPVKANAYGHGIVEVSQAVERTGAAQWLGVAEVSEGLLLRESGIRLPILKFSPCLPDEVSAAIAAGLTLTVADVASVALAQQAAARLDRHTAVHLKVDTGMGRVGCGRAEAVDLVRAIDDSSHLSLGGLFTHYAQADTAAGQDLTRGQAESFATVASLVEEIRGTIPWVHAANSAGVLAGHLAGGTLVRPGIMSYGCQPCATEPSAIALQPTATWTTAITFIKTVSAGQAISYGGIWTAPRDTVVATIGVGYGDGFARANSGASDRAGGAVLVGGRLRPVVGRVCMDQTMIDLGPDPRVQVGDEVVLVGRQGDLERSWDDLAAVQGTISYEVLTSVAARVNRRHLDLLG